jgi:hypothetical protein
MTKADLGVEYGLACQPAQIVYGTLGEDLEHLRGSVLRECKGSSVRESAREANLSVGEVSTVLQGQGKPTYPRDAD